MLTKSLPKPQLVSYFLKFEIITGKITFFLIIEVGKITSILIFFSILSWLDLVILILDASILFFFSCELWLNLDFLLKDSWSWKFWALGLKIKLFWFFNIRILKHSLLNQFLILSLAFYLDNRLLPLETILI